MVLLLAPLVAVIRQEHARRRDETALDLPLAIALLAYPPITIAMRLVEICAADR
jgi:hypothetical protein